MTYPLCFLWHTTSSGNGRFGAIFDTLLRLELVTTTAEAAEFLTTIVETAEFLTTIVEAADVG